MDNEDLIRQVAREVGVAEHIALAFAQAESNGRMVYGHDAGGVHSTRDGAVTVDGIEWPKGSNIPVTDTSFRELERRVGAGEKSNGVGIMQITYRGFFPDARKKGLDLATAADNVRYGLTLIRGYLAAAPEGVDPLTYAASRYNRGSVYSGPYHYTDRVNAYARAWALLEPKELSMATSHNGWPVITSGLWPLPAVSGSVKAGPVWVIMNWLAREYARRVEPIERKQSWGYAHRKIGGSTLWSNHASGTAADFNAPKHPLKTRAEQNFTPTQIRACEGILADAGGVLRWLRGHDPMHWEIAPETTPEHEEEQ